MNQSVPSGVYILTYTLYFKQHRRIHSTLDLKNNKKVPDLTDEARIESAVFVVPLHILNHEELQAILGSGAPCVVGFPWEPVGETLDGNLGARPHPVSLREHVCSSKPQGFV